MNIEEARTWLTSSAFLRDMQDVDDASDDALEEQSDNLALMSLFRGALVSQYRRDGTVHNRARLAFNDAVNAFSLGRARDGREMISCYRRYVESLDLLELQNARYAALASANVASSAAALIAAFIRYTKRMRRRCRTMLPRLRAMDVTLRRLRDEVEEARAQRAINTTISALGLVVMPVSLGARLVFAASSISAQLLVDYSLGPSRPGGLPAINTAYGSVSGIPSGVSTGVSRFAGSASTLLSFHFDSQEVDTAEENLRRFRRDMPAMRRDLRALERFLINDTASLTTAKALYEGAERTARREYSRFRSSAGDRQALLRQLSSIR